LDFYPLRRLGGRVREWLSPAALWVWFEKLPFAVIAALTAVKAVRAQAGQLETMKSLAEHPLLPRVAQMLYGAAFYVWKTLLPFNLIPLYDLNQVQKDPWEPRFVISALGVIVALAVVLGLRRRWPAGLALAACYLAIYSPVSGIAQSGPQLVKDSYSYLCCLSWAVLLGGVLVWSHRRWGPRIFGGVAGAAVVGVTALGVSSWRQTGIWRDSKTLWAYTLRMDDQCALAHNNLAILQKQDGDLHAACTHYERSLELNPADADTHFNYANCLKALKRYDEAIAQYRQAIELQKVIPRRPVHEQAHINLGNTYRTLNRIPEAVEHHIAAAQARRDPELEELIARELRVLGRLEEAERYFRRALQRDPGFFEAHFGLGQLLLQRGECAEALRELSRATDLQPDSQTAARELARAQTECRKPR
ncbi:MAG: tetratricopeptide repeat protein, partial [Planctomycetota bacterium]